MRTYVTSLHGAARLAHIGTSYWTACGFIVASHFIVSEEIPEGRVVCPRCAAHYPGMQRSTLAQERARTAAAQPRTLRENQILTDLRRGRRGTEIVRAHKISQRSYVRYVSRMRRRLGARTMFQFGFLVGLAERD